MKHLRYEPFFCWTWIFMGLLFSTPGFSETLQGVIEKTQPQPITIKSNVLEVDNDLKMMTFTGNVRAKGNDFAIDCEQMFVYYDKPPDEAPPAEEGAKIHKIIALGDVQINRVKGGVARADKVVYYQQDEKLVLMGNPMVKQGNDFVEGDRITVFLKENRSVVESSEDQKVRALVFPKGEKR